MNGALFLYDELEECLPRRFLDRLCAAVDSGRVSPENVTELRLRCGGMASVSTAQRNIPLGIMLTRDEIEKCVNRLCGGSMYAHADTVKMGYISLENGMRVGVGGRASSDGRSVYMITSVNIRIPREVRNVCESVLKRCYSGGRIRSVLIYSPPGVGKTTLLRDLSSQLGGKYGRRVAVIDSRGEIFTRTMFEGTMCDILCGYPRAAGIEIATRTMSPEVIVTDELGDAEEARQILSSVSTGVPLIATAHAGSVNELMRRPNIRQLIEARVFDLLVGMNADSDSGSGERRYGFTFTECEELQCTF